MAKKPIPAVINPQTRQTIVQSVSTGLNAAHQPIAKVPAVKNPLARQKV